MDNFEREITQIIVGIQKMKTTQLAMRRELEKEIEQLTEWANESKSGGWSTHQVKPMLARANELRYILAKLDGVL